MAPPTEAWDAMKFDPRLRAPRSVSRRRSRSLALGGGLAFAVALVAAVLFLTEVAARRGRARARGASRHRRAAARRRPADGGDDGRREGARGHRLGAERSPARVGLRLPALAPGQRHDRRRRNERRVARRQRRARQRARPRARHARDDRRRAARARPRARARRRARASVAEPRRRRSSSSARSAAPSISTRPTSILCDEDDARALLGLAADRRDRSRDRRHEPGRGARRRADHARAPPGDARRRERTLGARLHLAYGRRAGSSSPRPSRRSSRSSSSRWDRASGLGPTRNARSRSSRRSAGRPRTSSWAKLFESLLVAALATAAGLLLGYAWVFWLGAPGLRRALVGWSVLYPQTTLTPMVDFAQLLGIAAATRPVRRLSVVPAWRAAILDPMDAMRADATIHPCRRSRCSRSRR